MPNSEITSNSNLEGLFKAIEENDIDLVKALILSDKNLVNLKSSRHDNFPLINACYQKCYDIVAFLLESGANVDQVEESGWSSLMFSSLYGYENIVRLLLRYGANVNHNAKDGSTALTIASHIGDGKIVETLLRAGANVNHSALNGWTALMLASRTGHDEVVEKLLKAGAIVDAVKSEGWTALMLASLNGHEKTIELLLKAGASKDLKNNDHKTAEMVAVTPRIAHLIHSYGNTYKERLLRIGIEDDRIPNEFLCPISREIMEDPITISSGVTYDRASLLAYVNTLNNPDKFHCPTTRRLIDTSELEKESTIIIKNFIEKFVASHERKAAKKDKQCKNTGLGAGLFGNNSNITCFDDNEHFPRRMYVPNLK